MDLDLVLIKQKRILSKQITEMNSEIKLFLKNGWNDLHDKEKAYFWKKMFEKKNLLHQNYLSPIYIR